MDVTKEKALLYHRLIARTRALCQTLEGNRPRIEGPVLTGLGAEALSVGATIALLEAGVLKDSILGGDQRTQYGFALGKNEAFPIGHDHMYEIFKNYALAAATTSQGEDGNIHWGCLEHRILPFACSDMGRMMTILVGMSEELRRREWPGISDPAKRPVAIGAFGEGAMNQGCIHEALNWLAAANCRLTDVEMLEHEKFMDDIGRSLKVLRGAPVIFMVNRNQFAIYTGPREEHGRSNIAERALGYGNMKGVYVRGWDVFDVVEKVGEAVRNAQELIPTLMDVETFRLTGHNADQIKRKPGVFNEGEILGLAPEKFKWAWENRDPLKFCREVLVLRGLADEKELKAVEEEELKSAQEFFDRAFTEPSPTLDDRAKKTMLVPHVWPEANPASDQKGQVKRYKEAFVDGLAGLLRTDERVTIFGEDLHLGGVLGETAGRKGYLLAKEFGEVRVHTMPISEEAGVGSAAGRALMGGKPWVFFQFAPFWADSYPVWRAAISTNWFQKKMRYGFVAVAPFGVVHSGGSGEYHEATIESSFYAMDGVVILFPTDAYDVVGLVNAANDYEGPVLMCLQTCAFGDSQFSAFVPDERYVVPFGQAKIRRGGKDISVIAYGAAAVRAAENEAEFLSREGIDLEVVDIRSLRPLDLATLVTSAKKTGRVVIMHEARESDGCGMAIKHELDKGGATLKARTPQSSYILAAENNPCPTRKEFLWKRLPFEQYVLAAEDNFGEGTILRSTKLARLARELMRY